MEREFYVIAIAMFFIICWIISAQHLQNNRGDVIFARTTDNAKQIFANIHDIPTTHVIVYKHEGRKKTPHEHFFLPWKAYIQARPVVGDHIHMAISFLIHGNPRLKAEHDREPIETIEYETAPPQICNASGHIAYKKTWPHAGVHTHCDGLIHVHPWSSPRSIRKQGLDIQLGLWFDQVGIEYRETPLVSLQFADGTRYDSNETHQWHIAEKKCFLHNIEQIYTNQLDTIWLGHAYASYIAWFGKKDSNPPNDIPSHIQSLKAVGANGMRGQRYPQDCYHI